MKCLLARQSLRSFSRVLFVPGSFGKPFVRLPFAVSDRSFATHLFVGVCSPVPLVCCSSARASRSLRTPSLVRFVRCFCSPEPLLSVLHCYQLQWWEPTLVYVWAVPQENILFSTSRLATLRLFMMRIGHIGYGFVVLFVVKCVPSENTWESKSVARINYSKMILLKTNVSCENFVPEDRL